MNIKDMSFEDYMNLYFFIKSQNKLRYKYTDWIPKEEDIEKYNEALETFKSIWEKDKARIEKPIIYKNVQRDNAYIDRLNKAHEFEVFVENEFKKNGIDIGFYRDKENQYKGETKIGLEIKRDMQLKNTGNIFIEFQEKLNSNMSWIPSGIMKKDNTKWWIIGDISEYYIIYKSDLIKEFDYCNEYAQWKFKTEKKNGGTGQGFILSRDEAKRIMIADNIDEFINKVGEFDVYRV